MKCLLISESEVQTSGFNKMGVETILCSSDDMATAEVEKAIGCRNVGTLILSNHVREVSKSVLEKHLESGRLPFVMTLNG